MDSLACVFTGRKLYDLWLGAGTAAAGEAKERKAEFTSTKCKILATMLRFGTPLEKVKALAYFNTVAYVVLS